MCRLLCPTATTLQTHTHKKKKHTRWTEQTISNSPTAFHFFNSTRCVCGVLESAGSGSGLSSFSSLPSFWSFLSLITVVYLQQTAKLAMVQNQKQHNNAGASALTFMLSPKRQTVLASGESLTCAKNAKFRIYNQRKTQPNVPCFVRCCGPVFESFAIKRSKIHRIRTTNESKGTDKAYFAVYLVGAARERKLIFAFRLRGCLQKLRPSQLRIL